MNNPKLSVIIPVYNGEEYVASAIDSVLSSTLSDIEIIIVNDGSTDSTPEIIDGYAEKHDKIRVIHKKNGGVSSARNAALDIARGEFVGFIDSDDIALPDIYEYMIGAAESLSLDVAQCATLYVNGEVESLLFSPMEPIIITPDAIRSRGEWIDYLAGGSCSKIFRREILRGVRFDEKYKIGEDMLFNLTALIKARGAVLLPEAKYRYIRRSGSATEGDISEESLTSYPRMLAEARELFSDYQGITDLLRREAAKYALHTASRVIRSGKDMPEVIAEARRVAAEEYPYLKKSRLISRSERLKLYLLAYAYPLYKAAIRLVGGRR